MKIKVPAKALQFNYTDRYLVFLHYMLTLMQAHGKRTNYTFFAKDVKKILDEINDPHMHALQDRLKPLFKVAILNVFTLRFTWIEDKDCEVGKGLIDTVEVDIEDRGALNIYFYLLGRFQDPAIVDSTPVLYHGKEKNFNNLQHTTYKLFEE